MSVHSLQFFGFKLDLDLISRMNNTFSERKTSLYLWMLSMNDTGKLFNQDLQLQFPFHCLITQDAVQVIDETT